MFWTCFEFRASNSGFAVWRSFASSGRRCSSTCPCRFWVRKNRGRQRPPIALNGLPPPLERRKEYYEKACLCRSAVFSAPLTKQSIRSIPQRAKHGGEKSRIEIKTMKADADLFREEHGSGGSGSPPSSLILRNLGTPGSIEGRNQQASGGFKKRKCQVFPSRSVSNRSRIAVAAFNAASASSRSAVSPG